MVVDDEEMVDDEMVDDEERFDKYFVMVGLNISVPYFKICSIDR